MGNIKAKRRKATNLSIDADLLEEAKALNINLSQTAEAGLRQAVSAQKAEKWRQDNAAAIAEYNQWVEENGLPLADLQVLRLD